MRLVGIRMRILGVVRSEALEKKTVQSACIYSIAQYIPDDLFIPDIPRLRVSPALSGLSLSRPHKSTKWSSPKAIVNSIPSSLDIGSSYNIAFISRQQRVPKSFAPHASLYPLATPISTRNEHQAFRPREAQRPPSNDSRVT